MRVMQKGSAIIKILPSICLALTTFFKFLKLALEIRLVHQTKVKVKKRGRERGGKLVFTFSCWKLLNRPI